MKHSHLFKLLPLLSFLTCFFGIASLLSSQAVFAKAGQHNQPGVSWSTVTNSDWTMFDFHHSRFNANEHTLSTANVSHLSLAWSIKPSTTALGGPLTEMVVANGIVYTTSPNATSNDSLDALNEQTGKFLWHHILPSSGAVGGRYYLTVVNGLLYINDGSYAVAYNAATGTKIWSRSIVPWYAMVVVNGVVYVQSGLGYPNGQSSVYALNAQTGTTLWNVVLQQDLHSASPAVANGIVYVGAVDGTFLALNASTGKTLWKASLGTNNAIITAPVVDNGAVYVEGDSVGLFAFNASTGKRLWFAPSDPYGGSPAVAYGKVYLTEGIGAIQAYNETTGKLVWQQPPNNNTLTDTLYSATVANGVVFASANNGGPIAFDATTGKLLYRYNNNPYQGQNDSSSVVANGMLVFNMAYGYTDALKLK